MSTITDNIDELCRKHNLSGKVKADIDKLSIHSYMTGSNDAHSAFQIVLEEILKHSREQIEGGAFLTESVYVHDIRRIFASIGITENPKF